MASKTGSHLSSLQPLHDRLTAALASGAEPPAALAHAEPVDDRAMPATVGRRRAS